jgi:hypothetical protein
MKDNLTLISSKAKGDDLMASIGLLKRDLPALIEHTKLIARLRKESYDAHIENGFTEEQALKLCSSLLI